MHIRMGLVSTYVVKWPLLCLITSCITHPDMPIKLLLECNHTIMSYPRGHAKYTTNEEVRQIKKIPGRIVYQMVECQLQVLNGLSRKTVKNILIRWCVLQDQNILTSCLFGTAWRPKWLIHHVKFKQSHDVSCLSITKTDRTKRHESRQSRSVTVGVSQETQPKNLLSQRWPESSNRTSGLDKCSGSRNETRSW